jgi:8-oxo-dGDP phosphatase
MRFSSDDPDIRMLASGVVYEDYWMRLRRDDIERRDGSRGTYAFVEKRDFALVIPAERGGFHLVEEYRYPTGRRTWSFPQGGWPHGESGEPDELARLELEQETGLRARELVRLGYLHTAHGLTDQAGYFYLATGLEPGTLDLETEEQDMCQARGTPGQVRGDDRHGPDHRRRHRRRVHPAAAARTKDPSQLAAGLVRLSLEGVSS